jgi:hypothetical protein
MSKKKGSAEHGPSLLQIREYFERQAKLEREKEESRQRSMEQQLAKVTKGKNIIVLNASK